MTYQLVFVINQAVPHSKSSISVINSHTSKYAHSRRRRSEDVGSCNERSYPQAIRSAGDMAVVSNASSNQSRAPLGSRSQSWPLSSSSSYAYRMKGTLYCQYENPAIVTNNTEACKGRIDVTDLHRWDHCFLDSASGAVLGSRIPRELSPLHIYPSGLDTEEQFFMHHCALIVRLYRKVC